MALLWGLPCKPLDIVVSSLANPNAGKETIAFKVKKNALEKMVNSEDAITPALDDLDFIIETLNKTTIEPLDKIVGDVVKVVIQRGQEGVKTSQVTGLNLCAPGLDFFGRLLFAQRLFKNSGLIFTQVVGFLSSG